MKKRTIGKLLAFVLAMTMVFGNAMTTFACDDMYGECDGGCQKEWSGDGDEEHTIIGGGGSNSGDSGNSGGGSDSGSSGGGSYDAPSYDNSYDSGYDNSYSAPEASYDSYDNQSSFDAGSSSGSGSADASYVAPESDAAADAAGSKGYKRDGARLTVDNFETAWHLVRSANGTYNVKHMGQDAYMAQLMDAAGNAVGFKGAGMYRAEDGRLFINIVTADGVDTTGYTVCTWKGAASYLPKLGISGVCLNNTVMVDADAIVAAEAAAAK